MSKAFKVIQNKGTNNDSFFLMVALQVKRNYGFSEVTDATADGQAYGLFTDKQFTDVKENDIIEISKAELEDFTPLD
jgi:hypothetical protein